MPTDTIRPYATRTPDPRQGRQFKLNLGCGDRLAAAPWVNVDSWPGVGPDWLFDLTCPWPLASGTCAALYAGQVLEHLDYPSGVSACLSEASRCLRAGGVICVVSPDALSVEEKGCEPWIAENLRRGECRWPGDEHRWYPNRHQLLAAVEAHLPGARLCNVLSIGDGWPAGNRDPWDIAVLATKRREDQLP